MTRRAMPARPRLPSPAHEGIHARPEHAASPVNMAYRGHCGENAPVCRGCDPASTPHCLSGKASPVVGSLAVVAAIALQPDTRTLVSPAWFLLQNNAHSIMIFSPRRMSKFRLRLAINKSIVLSGLLAALSVAPALADDAADINKLMRAGQYGEALSRVDASLARTPRDAQLRFLKGVILAEQNKSAEAIAVFARLTEDHPTLPEPYNNLAVLYAGSGQYDKARAALDSAIRTNPTYATAYENLGDVHAKLASQAYDKALQLDSGNSAAKSKLTLMRSLVSVNGIAGNVKPSAIPPKPQEQIVASAPKPAPAPAAAPSPVPAAKPAEQAAAARPESVKPAPAKPEPPKQEAKAAARPAPENDERDDVIEAVRDWAKAWSAQDVKGYLSAYGGDFQVPNGQARKAWEDERRSRIAGKGRINVKIESPQVRVNGNTATVKFRQVYLSDQLTANTRKTLVLTRQGGKWKIRQENTGG